MKIQQCHPSTFFYFAIVPTQQQQNICMHMQFPKKIHTDLHQIYRLHKFSVQDDPSIGCIGHKYTPYSRSNHLSDQLYRKALKSSTSSYTLVSYIQNQIKTDSSKINGQKKNTQNPPNKISQISSIISSKYPEKNQNQFDRAKSIFVHDWSKCFRVR